MRHVSFLVPPPSPFLLVGLGVGVVVGGGVVEGIPGVVVVGGGVVEGIPGVVVVGGGGVGQSRPHLL